MYTIEEAFSTTHISTFNRKRSTWADKVLTVKHIIDKYWYSTVLQYTGKGWLHRNILVVYYYNFICQDLSQLKYHLWVAVPVTSTLFNRLCSLHHSILSGETINKRYNLGYVLFVWFKNNSAYDLILTDKVRSLALCERSRSKPCLSQFTI